MRGSTRFFIRNATGSSPAFAAITSMWDSLANVWVLTDGARQGPTPNGCRPAGWLPCHPPCDTVD